MPTAVRLINVFVSCPGDVENEKQIVKQVCEILSTINTGQMELKVIEWKANTFPLVNGERAQSVINAQLKEDYDIYVGIFWKRFGDKQSNGLAPTEEEFENAFKHSKENKKPLICVYFKKDPFYPSNKYETEQFLAVQTFKEKIEKLGLYAEFLSSDFQKKIIEDLGRIIRDWDKLTSPEVKECSQPPEYLPRKAIKAQDYDKIGFSFLLNDQAKDMVDIITQNNRVVLLGDAGVGKTTELKRIKACFSKDASPYKVFFVSLNKYVDQPIPDLLGPSWTITQKDKPLLIMDGLDEIEAKNKNTAVRRIEAFCEENPSVKVIISCRRNFYNIEKQEPGTLDGFSAYILLDIDEKDIEKYIANKLSNQAEAFKNEVSVLNLSVLLRVPFYLVSLVKLFSINKQLPENKATIFEHLINNRIKLDSSHFRTTIELEENRRIIYANLERLALGMEMLGKNYLTNEEFAALIENQQTRDLTKYCTAWTKNDGELITWQFEHNNFQEYFAAKALSEKPLELIKNMIAFKPDFKMVIPSWVNTISFLLNMSKDQLLYNWVLENEPELIIKTEPTRIEDKIRIKIFKDIFSKYKQKQIWIPMEKYDYRQLARFAQSDDVSLYLITEIEEASHYTTCCNAIQLLSLMNVHFSLLDRAAKALVNRALEGQSEGLPINEEVQGRALIALSRLGLNTHENIDAILSKLKATQNDMIRYGLYYFLRKSAYLDEYIDVFLEGIRYVSFEVTHGNSVNKARVGNELWNLKQGLEQAKSPEAIKKILLYFIGNWKKINNTTLDTVLSALADNTAAVYCHDPAVLDLAINLLSILVKEHRKDAIKHFIPFFDNTKTRKQTFEKIFNSKQTMEAQTISLLATIADTSCLMFLAQQYESKNINDNDIRAFQSMLGLYNYDLYLPFNTLMNKKSGNKFLLAAPRNFEKERREKVKDDLTLLFQKENFVDELKKIYQKEQKRCLSTDEIIEIMSNSWDDPYFSDLAIHTLLEISKNQPISLESVIQMVDSWDWDWFIISKLYEYFNSIEDLMITDEQKAWIGQWCISNLSKVDFKKALITKASRQFSASPLAIYLWYFLIKFDLKYPSSILLDMLSFDWVKGNQMFGTRYLEAKLPANLITKRTLENLSSGVQNDDVLKNHLDICARFKIKECMPFAIKEIAKKERSLESRREALNAITEIPGGTTELEMLLSSISDSFRWEIVERLASVKSKRTREFLLEILENESDEEKLNAASCLLIYQDIEGLKYYTHWIESHNSLPKESLLNKSPLEYLEDPTAVPALMELLRVSYNEQLREDIPSLYSIVLKVLTAIALKSEPHYTLVRQTIGQFMTNYKSLAGVEFLNIFLEDLEEKYYVLKGEKLSIHDVVSELNLVFS